MNKKEIYDRRTQLEFQRRMLTLQINRSSDKEELKEVKKELKKIEKEDKKLKDEYKKIISEELGGKTK